MTVAHRISALVISLLAATAVTFGAGWLGYQSARADGEPLLVAEDTLNVYASAPGTHEVTITQATGERFIVYSVVDAQVDGAPILLAQADTSPALPDAGSASAPVALEPAPETKPADKLHDPLASPQAAFDDLKAAKKLGWGVLVLAVLIMTCRVLGRLGGAFKFLATGKVAILIGAVGTLAMTAYNALVLGGTWMAALAAAIVAGAAFWDAQAKPKESAKATS